MRYRLTLYIAGRTGRSIAAIRNIHSYCEATIEGNYVINVIDILEHPDIAEREKIVATPALIRDLPPPRKHIVGDLSDFARVMAALEIEVPSAGREKTNGA